MNQLNTTTMTNLSDMHTLNIWSSSGRFVFCFFCFHPHPHPPLSSWFFLFVLCVFMLSSSSQNACLHSQVLFRFDGKVSENWLRFSPHVPYLLISFSNVNANTNNQQRKSTKKRKRKKKYLNLFQHKTAFNKYQQQFNDIYIQK